MEAGTVTVTAEDKQQESGLKEAREVAALDGLPKAKDAKPAPERKRSPQSERGQAVQALLGFGQPGTG